MSSPAAILLIVDLALATIERAAQLAEKAAELAEGSGELTPEERAEQDVRIEAAAARVEDVGRRLKGLRAPRDS